jgi:profilin
MQAGEGAKLSSYFKNPQDALTNGITINGVKYLTIKADNRSIYGKKGAGGIVTVKTGQCILVAVRTHTHTHWEGGETLTC